MFKRRRDLSQWPWALVVEQTVYCVVSDLFKMDVRAATVLHLDERLLPKGGLEEAAETARRAGVSVEGAPGYLVLGYACDEDDYNRLNIDRVASHLVHENRPASTIEAASALARDWVGADATERSFHELPSVYHAAYYQLLTGLEFPRFRGHLTAGPSGPAWRMSIDAQDPAVFQGVQA